MKKQDCFYGIYPIKFIWRGNYSDPLISYKKHTFNYWDIENLFYEIWKGEPEYLTANLTSENTINAAFSSWMNKNGKRVKNYLNYLIDMEKE